MQTVYLRHLALAQKTTAAGSGSPFGQGFNYRLEVTVEGAPLEFERRLEAVLTGLDHKALGVDVELGFEPSTAALARFIAERLAPAPVREVYLARGDGYGVRFRGGPP